jgi:Tol biopolymer transport system component
MACLLPLLTPLLLAATPGRQVAAVLGANLQRPDWSPTGERLSYEANFIDRRVVELYVGEPDTTRFSRVRAAERSQNPLTLGFATGVATNQVVHQLSWSPPDLNRYVYTASNAAQDYDVYLDGSGPIASGPGADGDPRWSPDGRYVAFTSARSGEGDLYLFDRQAPTAPPRRITQLPGSAEVDTSWSRDGRRLAFVAHASSGDRLWLLGRLDGAPAQLTTMAGSQNRPSFSPSADLVAFYANPEDPARWDLYAVPLQPAAVPKLLAAGVVPNALGPSWTPDGTHVVYVRKDDEAFDPIAAVRVSDTSRVLDLDFGTVGNGDLDLVQRSDGVTWIAWVAQGRAQDALRDYQRVFIAPMPTLP